MKIYNHFINGKEMLPDNGEYFETENPYTCEKWAKVAKGNANDVDAAENIIKNKIENFIKNNAKFFEDVGAKAVQGQAYLPGSEEKEE